MAIFGSSNAAKGEADADAAVEPSFERFALDKPFQRALLIPKSRRAFLASEAGRGSLFDLDRGTVLTSFELPSAVDDLVIDESGDFAYLVGAGELAHATLWRMDLTDGTLRGAVPLPFELPESRLALRVDGLLVVAGQGTTSWAMMPIDVFDREPAASETQPFELVWSDLSVAALTALPSEALVVAAAAKAPEVYGLDTETLETYLLTSLRQPGDVGRPLAVAVGMVDDKGVSRPAAVVADQVGKRVMLFDYDRSFRAFDFVAEGAISAEDPLAPEDPAAPGETPLIVASADDLSAILVGSMRSNRVYFFARAGGVLKQLNVVPRGPVLDLDVAGDGQLGLILADGGTSLTRVDHPDAFAPFESSELSRGGDLELLDAQKRLAALGFPVGAVDGMQGRSTENAIRLFQRSQGLRPTGILDPDTESRLKDEQQRQWHKDRAEFEARFNDQGIRYFQVDEFLGSKGDTCSRSKPFPPAQTWCSAFTLAKTMDAFRALWGAPVIIETGYRHRDCEAGKGDPAYGEFRAVDLRSTRGNAAQWAELLERMRAERMFEGRVEVRGDRVHLELEPMPELWVSVGSRPQGGKFRSNYFDIAEPPNAGKNQVLNPKQTMNLRATAPRLVGKNWVWGERIAFLETNLALSVDQVVDVEKDGVLGYWVGGNVFPVDWGADDADKNHWFVVVQSHTTEARAHLEAEKLRKVHPEFSFDVYLADNGLFAIVAGADLDQGTAKKLVLEVRCAGLADDAFMRTSRSWTKKTPAPSEASP